MNAVQLPGVMTWVMGGGQTNTGLAFIVSTMLSDCAGQGAIPLAVTVRVILPAATSAWLGE